MHSDMMFNICVPLRGKRGVVLLEQNAVPWQGRVWGRGYQGSCDIGFLFYLVLVLFATLGTRYF